MAQPQGLTAKQMQQIARDNVEKHLGDCGCEDEDSIYENAYTLAFDALADACVDPKMARTVASLVAGWYTPQEEM